MIKVLDCGSHLRVLGPKYDKGLETRVLGPTFKILGPSRDMGSASQVLGPTFQICVKAERK